MHIVKCHAVWIDSAWKCHAVSVKGIFNIGFSFRLGRAKNLRAFLFGRISQSPKDKMQSKLIEIPFEKWPQLRDLYQKHKNRASAYNALQMFIDWVTQDPNLPLKIFTASKEWEIDGTYVVDFQSVNQLFCNTLNEDLTELVNTLDCFDKTKIVTGVPERIMPAVEKHLQHSGQDRQQIPYTGTVWQHVTREEALKFNTELPENITTRDLDETHAEFVNSVWPHRSADSEKFVRHLIKFNKSVGLFEGDQLVAWCLIQPLGSLGLLQVEESHRRKGLGKLVVKIMSKYLAEKGTEVTATVVFTNTPSLCMFKQLGFTIIDTVYWT
ncbi:uncharacterized protein LOC142227385 [Haematobia irritans]|uniref:uncharacterized protein LOC142227385 n=1 Tax=Haematobia irritans TaxID=7368 RepID=UPI003F50D47C